MRISRGGTSAGACSHAAEAELRKRGVRHPDDRDYQQQPARARLLRASRLPNHENIDLDGMDRVRPGQAERPDAPATTASPSAT